MNHDSRVWSEPSQQALQGGRGHGDAAGGRGEARPRHMNEHGAAAAGDPGPRVVVDLDDEVVERIAAGQAVAGGAGQEADRPVVAAVGRVLAPAVGGVDRANRQQGGRPWRAVAAPPQADRPEPARGRAAVPFPLVGLDAAAAERHGNPLGTRRKPAAAAVARPRPDVDSRKRNGVHGHCRGEEADLVGVRRDSLGGSAVLALLCGLALLAADGPNPPRFEGAGTLTDSMYFVSPAR